MKQHRRILSLALALCLGISTIPAHAATVTTKEFDSDGNVIREWAIDTETGTATPVESPAPEESTPPVEVEPGTNAAVSIPTGGTDGTTPTEPPEPTQPAETTDPNGPVVFTDVPADAWYAEAVNALAEGGLVQGVGDGKFDPNGEVTYGELATVLCRLYAFGEGKPTDGDCYLNTNSAYGFRVVSVRYLNEGLLETTHAPAHWAASPNYYLSTKVLQPAETEDLDVPAIRGSALVHIAYAALYAKSGTPEYVNAYTPADIPDWNNVLGVKHDIHGAYYPGREEYVSEHAARTIHVWPIDDELHFLPDEYVGCSYPSTDKRGYNMQSVADNDLDGQTYVGANPDLVLRAYNLGITEGVDEAHTCDVYGHLTRAELCAMLYRAGLTHKKACNWPFETDTKAGWYDGKSAMAHNEQYWK